MIGCQIEITTRKGVKATFDFEKFGFSCSVMQSNIKLDLSEKFPYEVKVTPPEDDFIKKISYSISTDLKNYYQVIVPDTGRDYIGERQMILYWYKKYFSRANNVRMPVSIITGMDHCSKYAFGIIGKNYESDFFVKEPSRHRALVAWMKRLTFEISRGTDEYPIPDEIALENADGSITEWLFFQEEDELPSKETWLDTLGRFSKHMMDNFDLKPRGTKDSMAPYWCSWTDWHSDDVNEEVIMRNVKEGVRLGIKNYIIDDGWFGPGLDTDPGKPLNIGEWYEDKNKIPELKKLVQKIKSYGANAIIWCAPHAVSPTCNVFGELKKYLVQTEKGKLMKTSNEFHSLCFRNPQARERMAEICVSLIKRYDFDGAKYDLYNCLHNENCCSQEHDHDTVSMIEGLSKTMELIDRKTRELKDDYIVELKQNYGTPFLTRYGTMLRAGDTPYDPEGNFIRAAYLTAYTPYVLNDYQTITNHDSAEETAAIVVKMLSVGTPSYSFDLPTLNDNNKKVIHNFHIWYEKNQNILSKWRRPIDPDLNVWYVAGDDKDIYFCINNESRIKLARNKNCEILNGTFCDKHFIELECDCDCEVKITSMITGDVTEQSHANIDSLSLNLNPGDMVEFKF